MAGGSCPADIAYVFRRIRVLVPAPDPALMRLVETTGAAARSCGTLREAVACVVGGVAAATGWTARDAWVPGDVAGEWVSPGGSAALPAHLALALRLEATYWAGDVGAVACPVYAGGVPVALLEWHLPPGSAPSPDAHHALGHLSGVLSEVAERPLPPAVPAPRLPLREVRLLPC